MSERNSTVRRLAAAAILAALSLVFSYIERLMPLELLVPVPGFRLGLSNIVLVFSVFILPNSLTFAVFLTKVSLTALLFGTPVSFAMSFAGGLLSVITMMIVKKIFGKRVGPVGVSVAGSVLHNTGQLIAASLIMSSPAVWVYSPALTLTGIATGFITGFVAAMVFKYS